MTAVWNTYHFVGKTSRTDAWKKHSTQVVTQPVACIFGVIMSSTRHNARNRTYPRTIMLSLAPFGTKCKNWKRTRRRRYNPNLTEYWKRRSRHSRARVRCTPCPSSLLVMTRYDLETFNFCHNGDTRVIGTCCGKRGLVSKLSCCDEADIQQIWYPEFAWRFRLYPQQVHRVVEQAERWHLGEWEDGTWIHKLLTNFSFVGSSWQDISHGWWMDCR